MTSLDGLQDERISYFTCKFEKNIFFSNLQVYGVSAEITDVWMTSNFTIFRLSNLLDALIHCLQTIRRTNGSWPLFDYDRKVSKNHFFFYQTYWKHTNWINLIFTFSSPVPFKASLLWWKLVELKRNMLQKVEGPYCFAGYSHPSQRLAIARCCAMFGINVT